MKTFLKTTVFAASLGALGLTAGALATVAAYFYFAPTLPEVDVLKEVRLQIPLRIYTRDGRLMAEFGDKRRIPAAYEEIPDRLVQAFIAAEDDRYFEHPGVDYQGLARAAYLLITRGRLGQGGSTITMQLARNFFLTPEKKFTRKAREIFLALKIEREFSKEEILTLYLNKIFLGQRAYGVGAAAEVYYGKTLHELDLAETATLAGLPQAPSRDNPVRSPAAAKARRAYVLRRMLEVGYISQEQHDTANAAPILTSLHGPTVLVSAPYVAEMVRAFVERSYGRESINDGYSVTTTLDSRLQHAAVGALRRNLHAYDRRHGYRGPLARTQIIQGEPVDPAAVLAAYSEIGALTPALIVEVEAEQAIAVRADETMVELPLAVVEWAKPYIDNQKVGDEVTAVDAVLAVGDVVYLEQVGDGWQLSQYPQVQGAFVALDPHDGAVAALTGGYDFFTSKFNRAVQAKRQPGSAFKPFVYSAALEFGLTPATLINDAPVVFQDAVLEDVWRPKNYSGRVFGPTRLREALVKSRNLVSIRVLDRIGIKFAIDHLQRFGFARDALPRDLSLALGSATMSPIELAEAYVVFANGGFEIDPYFIDKITDSDGEIMFTSDPRIVCEDCEAADAEAEFLDGELADPCQVRAGTTIGAERLAKRAIDPQNAYQINSMMRDVVIRGTGAAVRDLGRTDLAGKTGTTNDHRDAWFSGFNRRLVATTWIGFDQERPLGRGEAGATAALPAWKDFMGRALAGMPEEPLSLPPGIVTVRISPESGMLAPANAADAIFETFRVGYVPELDPGNQYHPYDDPEFGMSSEDLLYGDPEFGAEDSEEEDLF